MNPEKVNYVLNTQAIMESNHSLACVKILSKTIIDKGYVSFSEAMNNLNTFDLELLLSVGLEDQAALYCLLLALGEGTMEITTDTSQVICDRGLRFLVSEYFCRVNNLKLNTSLVTFTSDLDPSWISKV